MPNPWDNDPIITAKASAQPWENDPIVSASKAKPKTTVMQDIGQGIGNLAAGAIRGAGSIGATILWPADKLVDTVLGDREQTISGLVAGKPKPLSRNEERRMSIDGGLEQMGAEPSSILYKSSKLAGEIAGTAGAGGALANGLRVVVPGATGMINALATSGFKAGTTPGLANMATRVAGGALAGGAAAGLINPSDAGTGALIGGALPPVMMGIGKVGNALGGMVKGPVVPEALRQSAEAARAAGYVIPPTQVKPTFTNRLLEGFSGKLTTAQNASARNQGVTNELAKKAIGAGELTESGLAQVRSQANAAYDALGRSPAFQADASFVSALDNAGASTAELRTNFPELINGEIDALVAGLKSRPQFDAQPTIEAIKRFRADAAVNKIALDPAKKAMGQVQNKIAGALEDLIDRNLQQSGNTQLLDSYRAARQTLAKTYDVEKALNMASGNVDANKLATAFKKGRPLTNELRQIAEFSAQFPKATQTVEKMGSLPQVSPLDFAALTGISASTGNPLAMAGLLARPIARSVALGPTVQNGLAVPAGQNSLARYLTNPDVEQLIYRAAPVTSDR